MTSLLDVSILISLLDANHEHHAAVMGWWNQNEDPWASCPITQNGYLRIVTQQRYANTISVNEAVQKLTQAVSTTAHEFMSDDISLLDKQLVAHQHIQGPKKMTDIYLLALSVFSWCAVRDARHGRLSRRRAAGDQRLRARHQSLMTALTAVVGSGLRMPDDRGGHGVSVPGVGTDDSALLAWLPGLVGPCRALASKTTTCRRGPWA